MMMATAIASSNSGGTGTSAMQQAARTWQHWQRVPAIIEVCHQHAAVQPLSDGDGGTLQLQMSQGIGRGQCCWHQFMYADLCHGHDLFCQNKQ